MADITHTSAPDTGVPKPGSVNSTVPPKPRRRRKAAFDPDSPRAKRLRERHEGELAVEAVRQEDVARKRRLLEGELFDAWIAEQDRETRQHIFASFQAFATAGEAKLLASHPMYPAEA